MKLSVKNHCIETAARNEHRRLQYSLQKLDEASDQFEEQSKMFEQLGNFLEKTDFKALRARHPELTGGHDITVELVQGEKPDEIEIQIIREGTEENS